jgi:transposase
LTAGLLLCEVRAMPTTRRPSPQDERAAFLDQLAGFYAGQRVVLIWDGLSSHWSTRMRAWLDSQRDWLSAERLPAHAPELNPVEYLWANLKDVELANLPTTTLAEVADAATQGVQRACKRRTWWSGSSPAPASPSTPEPSTQPTKLK